MAQYALHSPDTRYVPRMMSTLTLHVPNLNSSQTSSALLSVVIVRVRCVNSSANENVCRSCWTHMMRLPTMLGPASHSVSRWAYCPSFRSHTSPCTVHRHGQSGKRHVLRHTWRPLRLVRVQARLARPAAGACQDLSAIATLGLVCCKQ